MLAIVALRPICPCLPRCLRRSGGMHLHPPTGADSKRLDAFPVFVSLESQQARTQPSKDCSAATML